MATMTSNTNKTLLISISPVYMLIIQGLDQRVNQYTLGRTT
jgi:hypothetical protein